MAKRPAVTSRKFQRAELAALFGNNMRAIAAFEALGADVAGTLPDAVGEAFGLIELLQQAQGRTLRVPEVDGIEELPAADERAARLLGFDDEGAPLLVPFLTPFMFGAAGDGITDDTDAVQRAIDAATGSSLSAGVVTGMGFTFAVSRQLSVGGVSDATLEDFKLKAIPGAWPTGEAGAMLLITRPTSDATSRSRLSRLTVNCNGIAKTGVYVKSAGSGTVINTVRVLYFSECGFWLGGAGDGNNDVKMVACGAHETTSGIQPKASTYSARTGIGILVDGSADMEFVGCTVSMCRTALVVRNIWNGSFVGCKFWNGPVRSDPTSLTVSIEATANRCQFTGCRFDDGAVRLYAALGADGKHKGMNHSFVGCAFIQFPSGLLQLSTSVAGETAKGLTVVGCILEQDDVVLLTEGGGTWGGVQCEFVGNRTSSGTDTAIQGCTAVTGAMRLRGAGQLQVGNDTSGALPTASSISPSIAAHGTTGRAALGAARWSEDASGALMDLFKSRGAAVGAYAPAQDGDTLGTIAFSGATGADSGDAGRGATIRAVAVGAWAGTRKAKLVLSTINGTATADRWAVDENGHMVPVAAGVNVGSPAANVGTVYAGNAVLKPAASVTPANEGEMSFELTDAGTLRVKVKVGGVVKAATLPLS